MSVSVSVRCNKKEFTAVGILLSWYGMLASCQCLLYQLRRELRPTNIRKHGNSLVALYTRPVTSGDRDAFSVCFTTVFPTTYRCIDIIYFSILS